jgi:threonyl-tRNA synthetase
MKLDPNSDLYRMRHSAAHVMAAAVCRLFPDVQLDIGPPTEDGFYYDFDLPHRFSPDDFEKIEAEMRKIIAEDQPFERTEVARAEAGRIIRERGQKYKIERLADIPDSEAITFYRNGEFVDLCRGPHVQSTGRIPAFKLLKVAGSYYRGDEKNPMMQRLYGTAFPSAAELEEHLRRLEEAKQRDHRVLGQKLGLFLIDDQVGGGLVLWKPKGARLRMLLEDFLKQKLLQSGYEMVYTPHIARIDLYKTSGHYPYYADSQFPPIQMREKDEQYLLRPMNCPHHIKIYASEPRSYRDLPVRLAEFGTVYRYEQSGELNGLTRVRGLTIDDAHIFCAPEQVKSEVRSTIELVQYVLDALGFRDVDVRLSLRDPASDKYIGEPAVWDRAEQELREALREMGMPFEEEKGEAAFYGPKIDFVVRDAIGRGWQLGTIQLDYSLPERFGLEYMGSDNKVHRPVMIHRAPFGSMERFTGILIEHFAGAFPLWLSPEQARILPITDKQREAADALAGRLRAEGFRVAVDARSEKVGAKIRTAQLDKVPYMLVLGGREVEHGRVAVRSRSAGDLGAVPVEEMIRQLRAEVDSRGQTVFMPPPAEAAHAQT